MARGRQAKACVVRFWKYDPVGMSSKLSATLADALVTAISANIKPNDRIVYSIV